MCPEVGSANDLVEPVEAVFSTWRYCGSYEDAPEHQAHHKMTQEGLVGCWMGEPTGFEVRYAWQFYCVAT